MTTTVEAIYEDGVLKLPGRLPLRNKTPVTVTIESGVAKGEDVERSAWLKLSEVALTTAWANPDDEAFNQLLKR